MWYLLAGTRGGETRARIIYAIRHRPANANQLAKQLSLDYKTMQHHLALLLEHNILSTQGRYGAVYFITQRMQASWLGYQEIWEQFGRQPGKHT